MPFINKTAVVLLATILAGCSSLNPFSSGDEGRNKPTPLSELPVQASLKKMWSVSVGSANGLHFQPILLQDSVVTAAADGTIARIALQSGAPLWRIKAGMPLTAGTGTDGSTVVVAGEKGAILAFTSNGTPKWKAQAPSEVLSAPAVGQGLVVIRSIDNQVFALDAETGERRWIVQRPLPPLTLRAAPGISLSEDTAYVALPGGRLSALSLLNGGPRWEVAVGTPRGTTELERIADVSGAPVLLGQSVCAVALQGRIGCFDAATGAPQWLREFSSDTGVSGDSRHLYTSNENGQVIAMARDTGAPVWNNDKLLHRSLSGSSASQDYVAVGDRFGYLHLLSSNDGSLVGRASIDASPIKVAPRLAGSTIIVQTQNGTLSALSAGKL